MRLAGFIIRNLLVIFAAFALYLRSDSFLVIFLAGIGAGLALDAIARAVVPAEGLRLWPFPLRRSR